jgi:hypothetical protein
MLGPKLEVPDPLSVEAQVGLNTKGGDMKEIVRLKQEDELEVQVLVDL